MDQRTIDELNDFGPMLLASGMIPFDAPLSENPTLENAIRVFDGFYSAGLLGGLLTVPELHCNCYRLETLSHLAIALGQGGRRPSKTSVGAWFAEAGNGICGRMEDPAEDVFVNVVTTPHGDFRVLEGTWESAGFYLQRFINVIDEMPNEGLFTSIKDSILAILKLSDLVCERAGLRRYQCGARYPLKSVPKEILDNLKSYRQRVVFSRSELQDAQITCDHLQPFVIDSRLIDKIRDSTLGRSPLVHHPLLQRHDQFVLALPTAISVAIRALVVDAMNHLNLTPSLRDAIAREYARFFRSNPPLGTPHNAHGRGIGFPAR